MQRRKGFIETCNIVSGETASQVCTDQRGVGQADACKNSCRFCSFLAMNKIRETHTNRTGHVLYTVIFRREYDFFEANFVFCCVSPRF